MRIILQQKGGKIMMGNITICIIALYCQCFK